MIDKPVRSFSTHSWKSQVPGTLSTTVLHTDTSLNVFFWVGAAVTQAIADRFISLNVTIKIGSLSTHVFETRTATGRDHFAR